LGSNYRNGNPRAIGDGNKDFLRVHGEFRRRTECNTCPVCLGLPGALPILNEKVVELGAKAALSLGLNVNEISISPAKIIFILICRKVTKFRNTTNLFRRTANSQL
jgi:hypothetical protein